ncbi:MAG: hypothetical protein H6659_18090 [Ardenticatenaceae bacterium]|nr:hypothetical protein [Ardenticatenaceae bacterium]
MSNKTMTFTARSQDNPEKMATFTLQNGSISMQLADALVSQVKQAFNVLDDDGDKKTLQKWLETNDMSAQPETEPIPVQDFEANLEDDSFQTIAWLREGGLRLAPVMLNWHHVDNPTGAEAFVEELQKRQKTASKHRKFPSIFDHWIAWFVAAAVLIALPVVFIRRWQAKA